MPYHLIVSLTVGSEVEVVGYVSRIISSGQTPNWTIGPFIVQTVLILVAPALFAATIYMELGRIILLVDGERHAILKKRWLTKVFVIGDVSSHLRTELKMNSFSYRSYVSLYSPGVVVRWLPRPHPPSKVESTLSLPASFSKFFGLVSLSSSL